MTVRPFPSDRDLPRTRAAVFVLAPAAWLVFHGLAWALPSAVCSSGGRGWLHVIAAVATALVVAGAVLVQRGHRGTDLEEGPGAGRPRAFLRAVGVLVGALLVLSIVASWGYVVAVDPCQ